MKKVTVNFTVVQSLFSYSFCFSFSEDGSFLSKYDFGEILGKVISVIIIQIKGRHYRNDLL